MLTRGNARGKNLYLVVKVPVVGLLQETTISRLVEVILLLLLAKGTITSVGYLAG